MPSLTAYERRRDFRRTPEPRPAVPARPGRLYLIQKHRASALHYDFRLEVDGVLRSWSVPKGPSLDPKTKRLAIAVEDHPVAYGSFEGVIPAPGYGAGTVMLWDTGSYEPEEDPARALRTGSLSFVIRGRKLRGGWSLVRTRSPRSWLLIKKRDRWASTEDIAVKRPRSVRSRRLLAGIARDEGGDVAKAATGDP